MKTSELSSNIHRNMVTLGEKQIAPLKGYTGSFEAPKGGSEPHAAFRPGTYFLNYSGDCYWNTWQNNHNDIQYRKLLTTNNGQATISLLLQRNQAKKTSPAPISLAQYAINTQQIFQG